MQFNYVENVEIDDQEIINEVRRGYEPDDIFPEDVLRKWAKDNIEGPAGTMSWQEALDRMRVNNTVRQTLMTIIPILINSINSNDQTADAA